MYLNFPSHCPARFVCPPERLPCLTAPELQGCLGVRQRALAVGHVGCALHAGRPPSAPSQHRLQVMHTEQAIFRVFSGGRRPRPRPAAARHRPAAVLPRILRRRAHRVNRNWNGWHVSTIGMKSRPWRRGGGNRRRPGRAAGIRPGRDQTGGGSRAGGRSQRPAPQPDEARKWL